MSFSGALPFSHPLFSSLDLTSISFFCFPFFLLVALLPEFVFVFVFVYFSITAATQRFHIVWYFGSYHPSCVKSNRITLISNFLAEMFSFIFFSSHTYSSAPRHSLVVNVFCDSSNQQTSPNTKTFVFFKANKYAREKIRWKTYVLEK